MVKTERWRHLEIDEVVALFDNTSNEKLIRFLMVMIGCACRPSAALELDGSRINRKEGLIDLLVTGEAQTNKYRPTIRLPSFIDAIYHKENIVTQSDQVVNINNMRNRVWLKARESAGLDDLVVPSSIRHTMAKWLRSQGVEAWAVSAQMGHSAKGHDITEIYAPSDPAYLVGTLKAIEDYFRLIYKQSKALQGYITLR